MPLVGYCIDCDKCRDIREPGWDVDLSSLSTTDLKSGNFEHWLQSSVDRTGAASAGSSSPEISPLDSSTFSAPSPSPVPSSRTSTTFTDQIETMATEADPSDSLRKLELRAWETLNEIDKLAMKRVATGTDQNKYRNPLVEQAENLHLIDKLRQVHSDAASRGLELVLAEPTNPIGAILQSLNRLALRLAHCSGDSIATSTARGSSSPERKTEKITSLFLRLENQHHGIASPAPPSADQSSLAADALRMIEDLRSAACTRQGNRQPKIATEDRLPFPVPEGVYELDSREISRPAQVYEPKQQPQLQKQKQRAKRPKDLELSLGNGLTTWQHDFLCGTLTPQELSAIKFFYDHLTPTPRKTSFGGDAMDAQLQAPLPTGRLTTAGHVHATKNADEVLEESHQTYTSMGPPSLHKSSLYNQPQTLRQSDMVERNEASANDLYDTIHEPRLSAYSASEYSFRESGIHRSSTRHSAANHHTNMHPALPQVDKGLANIQNTRASYYDVLDQYANGEFLKVQQGPYGAAADDEYPLHGHQVGSFSGGDHSAAEEMYFLPDAGILSPVASAEPVHLRLPSSSLTPSPPATHAPFHDNSTGSSSSAHDQSSPEPSSTVHPAPSRRDRRIAGLRAELALKDWQLAQHTARIAELGAQFAAMQQQLRRSSTHIAKLYGLSRERTRYRGQQQDHPFQQGQSQHRLDPQQLQPQQPQQPDYRHRHSRSDPQETKVFPTGIVMGQPSAEASLFRHRSVSPRKGNSSTGMSSGINMNTSTGMSTGIGMNTSTGMSSGISMNGGIVHDNCINRRSSGRNMAAAAAAAAAATDTELPATTFEGMPRWRRRQLELRTRDPGRGVLLSAGVFEDAAESEAGCRV